MKLNVLESENDSDGPWYVGGLKFTCTVCGNCCTGGPGYVWVTKEEIVRLAGHLKLTPAEVVERYCRRVNGKLSFKERRMPNGEHDCVFLQELPEPAEGKGRGAGARGAGPAAAAGVFELSGPAAAVPDLAVLAGEPGEPEVVGPGGPPLPRMNHGGRQFTAEQVKAIRSEQGSGRTTRRRLGSDGVRRKWWSVGG